MATVSFFNVFVIIALTLMNTVSVGASEDKPERLIVEKQGTLTKSKHAHTKLSMIHGTYHLQTKNGKFELLSTEQEKAFEGLLGKTVKVKGELHTNRKWTSEANKEDPEEKFALQRPSLEVGQVIRLLDGISVQALEEIKNASVKANSDK